MLFLCNRFPTNRAIRPKWDDLGSFILGFLERADGQSMSIHSLQAKLNGHPRVRDSVNPYRLVIISPPSTIHPPPQSCKLHLWLKTHLPCKKG